MWWPQLQGLHCSARDKQDHEYQHRDRACNQCVGHMQELVHDLHYSMSPLQAVIPGETEQALHERMDSHHLNICLVKTKEEPVVAHFCGKKCSIDDLVASGIDKTLPGDTTLRKHCESRLIRTLQTETPKGINLCIDRL